MKAADCCHLPLVAPDQCCAALIQHSPCACRSCGCTTVSARIRHPPLAVPLRFRSLFWARWTLFQLGLPKDVCRHITRNYLARAAFHAESEELRQERQSCLDPLPYQSCIEFVTCLLKLETGELVMCRCTLDPRRHYARPLIRIAPLAKAQCAHRHFWMRAKRPPEVPNEFFWRDGVCVVRSSVSFEEPCRTLGLG